MRASRRQGFRNSAFAAMLMLTLIAGSFTVAYFLTGAIYERTGLSPSAWLLQIINLLLGLFIAFVAMGLIISFVRSRGWVPGAQALRPIMTAMQQIAKGDFNIRLDNTFRESEPMGTLVDGVNTMAVQLGEMEQMRQEFISNVSHEIQSPLTSIRGFAQALQDEGLSIEQRSEYLDIIMSESTRLSRLSENLLRLASLEAKHPRFEPRPYRLDKQIRDIVLACEPQWTGKSLDIDVCLDKVSITADEDLLSQVWINLIGNAIKFTPEGGRMWVRLVQTVESVRFEITDTGIGVAEEDRLHLFERFYKADKSRTHSAGGSGLGLSIAKTIVEMHNGAIQVESSPGAGANFIVSIPAQGQLAGRDESTSGQLALNQAG